MKTREDAVRQLERIRRLLLRKCYFDKNGNLVVKHVNKRYERACKAFEKMFGELPTMLEVESICYPKINQNWNYKSK